MKTLVRIAVFGPLLTIFAIFLWTGIAYSHDKPLPDLWFLQPGPFYEACKLGTAFEVSETEIYYCGPQKKT